MEGPTNSEVLWAKIHLAEPRLFAATYVFWNHPDLAVLLPHFLIQAHYLMRDGLKFMALVCDRAGLSADPVSRAIAPYLRRHLEEELGHDLWLLDDICSLGFDRQQVLEAQPNPAIVSILGAQYFWAMNVHPVAILGYLILMEGYAPLASELEDIRLRSGAPATAFRCLMRHAEDDPAHLDELNRTLDSLALDDQQGQAVAMSAFAAIDGLATLFEDLAARHAAHGAPANDPRKELAYAGS